MDFYNGYDENDKGGFLVDDNFNETDITLFDMMMSNYNYAEFYQPKLHDEREHILEMTQELRDEIFPEWREDDESTWPPKMRWHLFLDKYPKKYIDALEAPMIFRSAMQCEGLSSNSEEFKWEYERMASIAPYAVKLFLQYCEITGVKWEY